jgi:TonB-dependent starch-binding outer membrane protein SusC
MAPHLLIKKRIRQQMVLLFCLLSMFVFAKAFTQSTSINGTVTDASDGTTLPGVNIVEKGTTIGTVTNIDGRYEITVSKPDAVLVFSYIGYVTQEVAVNGRSLIDVAMNMDVRTLGETVVIGYGVQRKDDLTGFHCRC